MRGINYTNSQLTFLVLLRWLVGWHLMYEGLTKISNPSWTSKGYLASADGLFNGFFHWIASSEGLNSAVDSFNMWGLFIIGLLLLVGFFSKYSSVIGAFLLFSYYLAHPPLFEPSVVPVEGSYLFVNKTLIEACALVVIALFPTDDRIGIKRLLKK
ncbi:MAG: DoxX family membrane protein [Ekhidna sp.]|nr:DoxX family membrane protein [Ekhidna sp.]